jgi:large subunit ribosomal protein L9
MKVVLKESYMSLGEAGDVVEVRPGYARNFLIPEGLAVTATRGNLKLFEDKAKEIQAKREKERENSKSVLGVIEKMTLTLKKKVSDEGKLFGSVTTKELEELFAKQGANVDRRQIVLGRQIKMIGDYSILVKLVGGMKANVALQVVSETPMRNLNLVAQEAYAAEVKASEKAAKNKEKAEKVEAAAPVESESGAEETAKSKKGKKEKKPKKSE